MYEQEEASSETKAEARPAAVQLELFPMMGLKTIDEHNAEMRVAQEGRRKAQEPHPNGIACTCGAELWDSSPTITLTSNPTQKHVHCPACGYRGYRIA